MVAQHVGGQVITLASNQAIAVQSIETGQITGRINSDIKVVEGFKPGQRHTFAEADLID